MRITLLWMGACTHTGRIHSVCFVTVFGSEPLVTVALVSKHWFARIDHKDVFAVFFWLNGIESTFYFRERGDRWLIVKYLGSWTPCIISYKEVVIMINTSIRSNLEKLILTLLILTPGTSVAYCNLFKLKRYHKESNLKAYVFLYDTFLSRHCRGCLRHAYEGKFL